MSNDKFRGWCAYICYIQCDIRCMCKKEIHTTIHNIININMIMKTESGTTPTYTKCRKHTNQNCNDFLVSRYI